MPRRIAPEQLTGLVGTDRCPIVIDVRRVEAVRASPPRIAGSVWRDHMLADSWHRDLPSGSEIVVCCSHGHNVSALAAALLECAGASVAMLDGGIEAYAQAGGIMVTEADPGPEIPFSGGGVWVTRERPKIDRIACPWLIRRFIDPFAVFHFVPDEWAPDIAGELGATPFDVEGVRFSHRAEACSFDTLLDEFCLSDPALSHLGRIIRGADTARPDLAPQAAGLLALSLGLSAIEPDDRRQLEKGMIFYDALLGWCRHAVDERHNWPTRAQAS